MLEIKNVTGTAFIVAEFRAEGSEETNPIYNDSIVKLFLCEEFRKIAKITDQNFPTIKEMVKLRTKYFDDVLSSQISLGCKQVVILGSGLDTRAIRKRTEGVVYFEIDARTTLEFKKDILSKNKITGDVVYIPGNYIKDNLISLLQKTGFDFNLPTLFLWEGNTPYITREEIIFVLRQIHNNVKNMVISFDYMHNKVVSRASGYQEINDFIDKFEEMGAPWLTGLEDIEDFAKDLGLKVIDNYSSAELHEKYRPGLALSSNLLMFYFVCTLNNF